MATVQITEADEAAVETFAGTLFMAALGAMELANVELGLRLGLYEALYDNGALTAPELAKTSEIAERYAREWLEHRPLQGS